MVRSELSRDSLMRSDASLPRKEDPLCSPRDVEDALALAENTEI